MFRETPHPFPGNPADFGPCEYLYDGHRDNMTRELQEIKHKRDTWDRRVLYERMLYFGHLSLTLAERNARCVQADREAYERMNPGKRYPEPYNINEVADL